MFILVGVLTAGSALGIPAEAELPTIPPFGWSADKGKHASWHRDLWQIADFNGDGKIDYIRFPDPPNSYNHRTWIDRDYDGRFDMYYSAGHVRIEIDFPAPEFQPVADRLK
jgi:hypothetical protein